MQLTGKIRGFATYSPTQLEQMKKDLGLLMPISFLRHCANYYTRTKRDPFIDELRMLDLFASELQKNPTAIAPTELQTNDAFVAATYADMIQKRKELRPSAASPISLGESLGLAREYLLRAGRKNELQPSLLFTSGLDKSNFPLNDAAVSSEGGFLLRLLPASAEPARKDDLFALLLPEAKEHSQACFDAKCNALLADTSFTSSVNKISLLSHGGLLYALARENTGIFLDATRLAQSNQSLPLSHLVTAYGDAYVIRFAREHEESIRRMTDAAEVRLCVFAGATTQDTFTVKLSSTQTISVHVRFLRSLFSFSYSAILLENEDPNYLLAPQSKTKSRKNCKYLFDPQKRIPTLNVPVEDKLASSASVAPEGSFFLNALYCGVSALLTQSLSGAHYATQQISIGLRFPAFPGSMRATSAAFGIALGLYRLQSETGVLATALRTESSPLVSMPTLSVFSVSKGNDPCPSVLQAAQSPIYAVGVSVDEKGLPDFDALRKTMASLAKMRSDGVILSARTVFGEKLSDALCEMEQDRLYCRIHDGRLLTDPVCPIAVIIEAACEIKGLTQIGTVAERESADASEPQSVTLLPNHSLIWSEQPEVVILAQKNDSDAKLLSALLSQNGANVRFFSQEDQDLPLSRALLGAQTLIICEDALLPHTPQVNFAYQTMRHAGGRVIALGNKHRNGALLIENGLTPQNVSVICQKN